MGKQKYVVFVVLVSMLGLYLLLPRGETGEQKPLNETLVKIAVTNPHYTSYPPWVDYSVITELIQADIAQYCVEQGTPWRFNFILYSNDAHPDERVEWMYENDYNYVIGLRSTSECDLWVYYQREYDISDMLLVSTGSAVPTFNGRFPGHELLFRVHTPYDVDMQAFAKYAYDSGITDVVSVKTTSSEEYYAAYFEEEFTRQGGRVHSVTITATHGVDWEPVMEEVSATLEAVNGTGGIFFSVIYEPEIDLFTFIEEYPNLLEVEWLMTDNMYLFGREEETLTNHSATVDKIGLTGIRPVHENNTRYRSLNTRYINATKMSSPPDGRQLEYSAALAYDSAWLIALSVIDTDSSDPVKVAETMNTIAETYTGITGPVQLNEVEDRVQAHYMFTRFNLVDGELVMQRVASYNCNLDRIIEETPTSIKLLPPL